MGLGLDPEPCAVYLSAMPTLTVLIPRDLLPCSVKSLVCEMLFLALIVLSFMKESYDFLKYCLSQL